MWGVFLAFCSGCSLYYGWPRTLVDIVWRFRGVLIMSAPPHLTGCLVECECLARADLDRSQLCTDLRYQQFFVLKSCWLDLCTGWVHWLC